MKRTNKIVYIWFFTVTSLFLMAACDKDMRSLESLKDSLTFYVSFDENFTADYAIGDPEIYIAPSWDQRTEFEVFTGRDEYLQIREDEGVYGNALWIDSEYRPVFFYRGAENIHYDTENWSGTVSFWMRLNPEEDLRDGYSDPIQITSRSWNDGSVFVDFTDENPRIFRFAVFPDRAVWDPEQRDWNEVPVDERPMVDVTDLPFSRNEWTHVALTFTNFNTGRDDGRVVCYINGEKIGELGNRNQTFTWNPEEVAIWIGYNYRGYFDELSIFDRKLRDEEILQIYLLKNGIRDIVR